MQATLLSVLGALTLVWAVVCFVAIWAWSVNDGFSGGAGLTAWQFWLAFSLLLLIGCLPILFASRWMLIKRRSHD